MDIVARLGGERSVTAGILAEFYALNRYPHGSRNEEAVSRYLSQRLAGMGLRPVADHLHNLMADVPATPGCEDAPLVILQGHTDMVCAVAPDCGFDPRRDSVSMLTENGFLKTDGRSSLGADNNLGNAAILWLLGQEIAHGPLRLIFTVAEEIGLEGAKALNPAWLEGAGYLINVDGFHAGRAVVASASGRIETFRRAVETVPAAGGRAYRRTLSGYPGGHSGDDIHKGRPNTIRLLTAELAGLEDEWTLAELEGGTALNVIPTWAQAVAVFPGGNEPPDGWEALDAVPGRVWAPPCTRDVLTLLNDLHDGVYAWHEAFPGVVSASANLGRVGMVEGAIEVVAFLRCMDPTDEAVLESRHLTLAEATGFICETTGFPSWRGRPDNPLATLLGEVWQAQTGQALEVSAVHVGLEPSFFQEKAAHLTMACIGPDILDAHSVSERVPLSSIPPFAALLAGALERLGQSVQGEHCPP